MELRCVHKSKNNEIVTDLDGDETQVEPSGGTAIGRGRKNGGQKEKVHFILNSVSKIVSQIKKPAHRQTGSPVNWFPRNKADSYLNRKIKRLQENEGMNLSLDEILDNANPHYTRIAREKIAAREAARKAMEARKVAMVEASWCRILRAARIESKEAKTELEKAEKCVAEAFEAARAKGVMMYDRPESSKRSCEVESSLSVGGKSTHTVAASFVTAFEVDKEVMAAIKEAFIQFANYSSLNKEEFKDLLWRISQNPDSGEDLSLESEFDADLVNEMLNRLRGLKEDELSSLATIVATCGLNAALLELEHSKDHDLNEQRIAAGSRRSSSVSRFLDGYPNKKGPVTEVVTEVPSLDKFLVKHFSRLEREVQEAKNSKCRKNLVASEVVIDPELRKPEPISDLGSILVKHVSKLEKEVQEARNKENVNANTLMPSPVKNISRLERAKLEVLNSFSSQDESSLDKILVKPIHGLEREKMQASARRTNEYTIERDHQRHGADVADSGSLDEILVKHVSRLEKEKMASEKECGPISAVKHRKNETESAGSDSLDKILVRHQPEIEKAKLAAAQKSEEYIKHVDTRKEAREKELQEAWRGLSLGNSIRPHLSRLERDRAAWKRAEDEERKQAREA